MLDSSRPGNVRYVNQPVNSIFDLDKSTEIGKVPDAAMNARADLVTLVQRLPRILLHLLHAEADAPRSRIDTQHFNLNQVAGIDDLARMLDAFRPAHFRNVNQPFNAAFELHERAIISHARDTPVHARADREALFDAGPRIGKELLVTEGDALALAIEFKNLDLNVVANAEQLVRILQTSPRHVGDVQQAVNTAEVDKGAVVGKILDLSFDHDVFFDLLESLIFPAGVLLLDDGFARQYNVGPFAVQLDHLRFNCLVAQAVEVSHWTNVNLRTGQESRDAVNVNTQAAFDAIDDATFHTRAIAISLLEVVPRLHAHRIGAREDRQAIGGFHAFNQHFHFVPGLHGELAVLGKLGGVNNAFRLVAKIDDHASFAQAHDSAANNFAFFESGLFLFELIE